MYWSKKAVLVDSPQTKFHSNVLEMVYIMHEEVLSLPPLVVMYEEVLSLPPLVVANV